MITSKRNITMSNKMLWDRIFVKWGDKDRHPQSVFISEQVYQDIKMIGQFDNMAHPDGTNMKIYNPSFKNFSTGFH
jgi:hypothetical protein